MFCIICIKSHSPFGTLSEVGKSTLVLASSSSMGAATVGREARRKAWMVRHVLIFLVAISFLCFILTPKANQGGTTTISSSSPSLFSASACNVSDGAWVVDPARRAPYSQSCPDIFKGWNCLRNGKPNALHLLHWRWQPRSCDLPPLDPLDFLRRFRHKSIGFVGDSLNRNMFTSLVCTLKEETSEVRKWRFAGADKAWTFLKYNVTLAYHRTNLLAQYGPWEAKVKDGPLEGLGYKKGFRVDVDVPQKTWSLAPFHHDILIFNTGHWWLAPKKFDPLTSPLLFFKGGEPILPPKSPLEGLDLALKHMLQYAEVHMKKNGVIFLRTQSPRHFEGADWDQNGTCSQRSKPLLNHEVDDFFSLERKGPNVEMNLINEHLIEAVKGTKTQILEISHMSSFRADSHPSLYGGKLHEDCMHWCLPGITDFWNDLFAMQILHTNGYVS